MEDELRPARGLVNGCMLGIAFWIIVGSIAYCIWGK